MPPADITLHLLKYYLSHGGDVTMLISTDGRW